MAGCLGLLLEFWGGQLLWALFSDDATAISPDLRGLAPLPLSPVLDRQSASGFSLRFAQLGSVLSPALKGGGRAGCASPDTTGSRWGLGRGLVVLQIGLSLTLLIGAGLLLRVFRTSTG